MLRPFNEVRPRGSAVVLLLLAPLGIVAIQRTLGLHGVQSSLYKLAMLIPPLLYCRRRGIRVGAEILRFRDWRRDLDIALALGLVAAAIFWVAYVALGDVLLDKARIAERVRRIFVTNERTVLYVAPLTIILNSLLEEFFYRGFAFGLLVKQRRHVAYVLPAAAFTIQHVLFFWDWMRWIPFCVAVAGLFVFAIVQQRLYEKSSTIVAPWVVHMFGDVALMAIAMQLFWPVAG